MADYRIDDLARAADTTVRNVRAYQDKGLLRAPRREGRVGIYTDSHLARLRLIGRLLARGYTVANIAELFSAWEQGRDLSQVLGIEELVAGLWSDERPGRATPAEVAAFLGDPPASPEQVTESVRIGLVEEDGDGHLRIPSPQMMQAARELVAAGVPLDALLSLGGRLLATLDDAARRLVEVLMAYIPADAEPGWMPSGEDIPRIARFLETLRPTVENALQAAAAQALQRHIDVAFGDYVARLSPLAGPAESSV